MLASYHVHSFWSDGRGSFEDYISKAKECHLPELGFSDHYALFHKEIPGAMAKEKLDEYLHEIDSLQKKYPELKIRKGLEADFFQETLPELQKILQEKPLDYVIGSVHIVHEIDISSPPRSSSLSEEEKHQLVCSYCQLLTAMAESHSFDIVGHLDLWKRYAFTPTIDFTKEIEMALDAIADADMAIEINTGGWHHPCQEAYPSFSILKKCALRNIPIIISSDAHHPDNLVRDFSRAKSLLKEAGFSTLATFEKRKRFLHPF